MTHAPRRLAVFSGLALLGFGAAVMGQGDASGAVAIVAGAVFVALFVNVRERRGPR
jgi:hypothetical protein